MRGMPVIMQTVIWSSIQIPKDSKTRCPTLWLRVRRIPRTLVHCITAIGSCAHAYSKQAPYKLLVRYCRFISNSLRCLKLLLCNTDKRSMNCSLPLSRRRRLRCTTHTSSYVYSTWFAQSYMVINRSIGRASIFKSNTFYGLISVGLLMHGHSPVSGTLDLKT